MPAHRLRIYQGDQVVLELESTRSLDIGPVFYDGPYVVGARVVEADPEAPVPLDPEDAAGSEHVAWDEAPEDDGAPGPA
jgi:hypothetical protein